MAEMNDIEQKALKALLEEKANEIKAKEEIEKASSEIVEFAKVEPAVKQLVDLGYDKKTLAAYPELAALTSDPARFRKVFLSRAKEMLEREKVTSTPPAPVVPAQPSVQPDKPVIPSATQTSDVTDDTVLNPSDPKFAEYLEKAKVDKNKIILFKMFNSLGKRNERLSGGH